MIPIPIEIRHQIAKDPFMKVCIYDNCSCTKTDNRVEKRVEWEHAFSYKIQINEAWNIVPVCTFHHRGNGLDKNYNKYRALIRADINDLEIRMPKHNWRQELKYLKSKYE